MAYTNIDFKSKAAMKRALQEGKLIYVYQPGLGTVPWNGTISVEGPHFPKPHTWCGTATITNGVVTAVK